MGTLAVSSVITRAPVLKMSALFIALALSSGSAIAAGISCAATMLNKGQWGYQQRAPERCEGEYFQVADNPGPSATLQVVSLVSRFGNVDPQLD
jgi:hypothetical protein